MIHTTHCEVMLTDTFLREGQTAAARAHWTSLGHTARLRLRLSICGNRPIGESSTALRAGSRPDRRRIFGQFVEHRTPTRSPPTRTQHRYDVPRVLAGKDECYSAADLLAPVYGWLSEGFDTADLKEAKALLDEQAAELCSALRRLVRWDNPNMRGRSRYGPKCRNRRAFCASFGNA